MGVLYVVLASIALRSTSAHASDPSQHTDSGCQIRESGNGLPESTLCRGDQRSDNLVLINNLLFSLALVFCILHLLFTLPFTIHYALFSIYDSPFTIYYVFLAKKIIYEEIHDL